MVALSTTRDRRSGTPRCAIPTRTASLTAMTRSPSRIRSALFSNALSPGQGRGKAIKYSVQQRLKSYLESPAWRTPRIRERIMRLEAEAYV